MNNENNNVMPNGNMQQTNLNNNVPNNLPNQDNIGVVPTTPINDTIQNNNNINQPVVEPIINTVQPEVVPPVNQVQSNNDPFVANNQNMNVEPIQTNVFQNDFTSSSPKKKGPNIIVILLIIIVLGAAGYGAYYYFVLNKDNTTNSANNNDVVENNDNTSDESDDNENNDNIVVDTDITLDDVKNAPVSPESDFEFVEIEDGTLEVDKYIGNGGIVVIPDEVDGVKVTQISSLAFNDETAITAVKLSDNVEYIGESAFILCENLQYFISGSGLKEIGTSAFVSATSLKYVELNEGLEKIGQTAFGLCTSLTELTMPRSVDDTIGSPVVGMSDDFVFKVYKDSYGEEFMLENAELMGVNYEVLD